MFNDYKTREDRLGKEESFFKTHIVDIAIIGVVGAFFGGFLTALI